MLSRHPLGDPLVRNTVMAHPDGTTSACFSPDGEILLTGGYDCRIRLWEVATGKERRSLAGHRRGHVAFSPEGALLVSGGLAHNAQVFETATWQVRETLEATGELWNVAFTPDGKRLATVQPDVPLQFWDTQTWRVDREVEVVEGYIYALAFSPCGKRMALATAHEGRVSIRSGRVFATEEIAFAAHPPFTYGLAFSADGSLLASAGADSTACLWDSGTGSVKHTLKHSAPALCVAFSPDGYLLATGSLDGTLTFWHLS